jgi:hypothetical protein
MGKVEHPMHYMQRVQNQLEHCVKQTHVVKYENGDCVYMNQTAINDHENQQTVVVGEV